MYCTASGLGAHSYQAKLKLTKNQEYLLHQDDALTIGDNILTVEQCWEHFEGRSLGHVRDLRLAPEAEEEKDGGAL